MHSVLFLILAFFNAAGLFVLLGAEFLAMILVVVYVGAVAVLFLFVVMMLDVDFAELRAGFIKNAPLGAIVGLDPAGRADPGAGRRASCVRARWPTPSAPIPTAGSGITNTEAIGRVLYTQYVYFFQGAGLILLVAMIGAIVLTLRHKEGVKRQSIAAQVARGPKTAVEVVKVASGGSIIPAEPSGGAEAMTIGLGHYLTVAAILFTLGIFGIFLNRKNVIVILMSIELMLLAVNINLVAFSAFMGDLVGQVFALFVLTVAAGEAAIGLAIVVVYFRNRGSIAVEDINMMKG